MATVPKKPRRSARRTHTESIEHALELALAGESAEGLIKQLSAPDQQLFYEVVAALRSGNDDRVKDLWRVDYVQTPPSMEEFIMDSYWLGESTRPEGDNPGLFRKWRELLIADFDFDSKINNLVITGSLGIGKTFVTCIILLYKITLARLLRNPQNFFGLTSGSAIYYTVLSISKQQVQQTAFGDLKNFMSTSRFFLDECGFDPGAKYGTLHIPLGQNVFLTAGSKGWHVIGRNLQGVCLDEGNWRNEKDPDQKAYALYEEARTRIQNRFQKMSGYLPAISILSSSAKDESSFTEKAIADIQKVNNPKAEKVYRYASYVIKRDLLTLSDKWFRVSYGLKNVDPSVLGGWCYENGTIYPDSPPLEEAPRGSQIEIVPEQFHQRFAANTKAALQGVSGVATGGSFRLIQSMADVERCIEMSADVPIPCKVNRLPISMDDDKQIWDFLDHRAFLTKVMSRVQPIRHPEALRYAHIDLATSTQAGVSICHPVGYAKIEGLYNEDAVQPYEEYRLVIEYDFILPIIAGPNKPISLEKIQKFFFWLRQQCGFNFGLITADQYQSTMPLQMLESRGYEVDDQSLDRNKSAYYAWRDAFTEHRLRLYRQGMLLKEMEELIDGPKKVDHPENGSKDVTDSAAGAYFNAINSKASDPFLGANSIPLAPTLNDDSGPPPPVSIQLPTHVFEPRNVYL